ncbi:hypothetical protein BC830DRAFT_690821 [Chytriomyces sp. MP71]|nr:hypothetical protein BC830DRAFT_690821 [Chytriomyces sp. MP71]
MSGRTFTGAEKRGVCTKGLNYHVLGAKHNKGGLFRGRAITADLWIDAVKLFRLELFNDLCKANPLVAMFSKHISTRFDEHPRGVDYLELYGNHVAHPRHAARPGKRKPNMDADPALFAQVRTLFLVDDSGSMTREGHASWSSLSDMSFMPFASKARGILTDLATGLMSGADSNALTPWFCNMCAFDNRAPIAFLCELCLAPGPQAPILPPIPTLNPNITKMRGIVGVGGGESGPALSGKSRWIQVRTLLAGMTDRIAQYNKRGVDVMFLNNSRVHGGVRQGEWMTAVFDGVGVPVGGTPTGASMHEILDAYTAVLRYDATFEALNVVVLTDGNANDFDLLQYTISHHVEMLTQRGCVLHQLGVEFVQVGDDEVATAQLDLLEEAVDAHRRNHARDVVGVTTARTIQCMDAEYATKLILAGIDARVHGYIRQSPQNH